MTKKYLLVILIISLSFFNCFSASTTDDELITTYKHKVEKNIFPISDFTFEELVKLSKTAEPDENLKLKLANHLLMTHVINKNYTETLDRPYIRVAHWNIERGFNITEIEDALLKTNDFETSHLKNLGDRHWKHFKEELRTFADSDILCLSEVDIGLPRTEYKNIPAELADLLGWNYAYTTEFVEVGPLFLNQKVDEKKYKGLHGNVIISRFPIISARVIRLPDFYDWYRNEVKLKDPPLEKFRKIGAKFIFRQHIERFEVRHGGRHAIIADIKLPNDKVW